MPWTRILKYFPGTRPGGSPAGWTWRRYTGRARSKQPVRLPWNKDSLLADLKYYRKLGVRHFTAFATGVNPDYQKLYGDLSFIDEYGACLSQT